MSAIGSVIVMKVWCLSRRGSACAGSRRLGAWACGDQWCSGWCSVGDLPAGLADAGELPGVRHLPQADPAQAELAEDRVRATAPLATGVSADRELGLAGRLVDQRLLGHVCLSPARLSGSC